MKPATKVRIDDLPDSPATALNANGKIDRTRRSSPGALPCTPQQHNGGLRGEGAGQCDLIVFQGVRLTAVF
jgi:hypothetical protein